MLSVSIYTLGCKLNQVESEALADAFLRCGFTLHDRETVPAHAPADLVIINTCTVTSRSDQKARRVIRKSLADSPQALVIATGCYAKLDGESLEALEGGQGEDPTDYPQEKSRAGRRLFVTGDKSRLLDLPAYLQANLERGDAGGLGRLIAAWLETGEAVGSAAGGQCDAFRFRPERFSFHTRGFLKIQDGCDNHCAYCRIRLARGPSVSMPAGGVLAELQSLEERGFWEAALTGVNISQYHDDSLSGAKNLGALLRYLLENTRSIGIRLSSLEPELLNEKFFADELRVTLSHPRIRPHFHLSVQSGSDSVLRSMGRAYTRAAVERALALLRAAKANPFTACDIITGFPGETEADFEQTVELCQNARFAWIHAFPYSKRPGTAASSLAQTVPEREAVRRVERLTELARQGRRGYAKSWAGAELEALVEKGGENRGACRALSVNYLRLLLRCPPGEAPAPGMAVRCVISELAAPEQEASGADAAALLSDSMRNC